jgi:lipopolysaccharide export system protein LptC
VTLPRLGHPWLLGLFGALAVLAWWYGGPVEDEAPPKAAPGHVPAQFGRDVRTLEMDAQGRPARTLESPHVVRFLDDGSTGLETPVLPDPAGIIARLARVVAHAPAAVQASPASAASTSSGSAYAWK